MKDGYLEDAWQRYVRLVADRPDSFHNPDPDGIVILKELEEVRAAEAEIGARLVREGYPSAWSRAGVFYEDPWIYVARDIVRFPTGALGTYHHVLMRGGENGVVVMPVFQGRIVLLRHFRNGLRNWSIEIPRGAPDGEPHSENARREISEEIGGEIGRFEYLGPLHNNIGMLSETMQIYYAELSAIGDPRIEEGIESTLLATPEEVGEMIAQSRITDAHTISAYQLARLKGFLPDA